MGMYNGGAYIRRLYWDDVSGFLEKVHLNTNNHMKSTSAD
jgi:hypothetical protein